MRQMEIGKVYTATITIGPQVFDAIFEVRDKAEGDEGYAVHKTFILLEAPAQPGQSQGHKNIQIVPIDKLNPMIAEEFVLMKKAISIYYEPKEELLKHYMSLRSGIVPASQMPPRNLDTEFMDLLKKGH